MTINLILALINVTVGIAAPLTVWLYARHSARRYRKVVKEKYGIEV